MEQSSTNNADNFNNNYQDAGQFNNGGFDSNMGLGGFKPNLPNRNIAMCVILSILTCGIYGLYWFVMLTDEVNTISSEQTASGGMALLFTLLSCGIYNIYWMYKKGQAIDAYNASVGKPGSSNAVLYLVLDIFGLGIVSYCLMQNELNNI